MKKLFRKIKELAKDGLFHIFGGSVVAKIVGVISSVVVIRGLPKLDYGHYVSANNLFSYFTAFVGLGLANAALQYCSEKVSENKKNGIHAYSMTMGMAFNILVTVMIFLLSAVKQWAGDEQVAHYLRLMAGLPFVIYANTYLQIVLRIKGNNQAFSFTNMMYSVSMLAGNVVFTMWLGIEGLILSTYLANVLAVGKSCLVFFQLLSHCLFHQLVLIAYLLVIHGYLQQYNFLHTSYLILHWWFFCLLHLNFLRTLYRLELFHLLFLVMHWQWK
jgi:O-antigen/teichoic acid export membrane protein